MNFDQFILSYKGFSFTNIKILTNSVAPDQRAPRGALWSGSTLLAKVYLLFYSTTRVKHEVTLPKKPCNMVFDNKVWDSERVNRALRGATALIWIRCIVTLCLNLFQTGLQNGNHELSIIRVNMKIWNIR